MANSTASKSAVKSPRSGKTIPGLSPRRKPPFPLWLHEATGQWAKKIRGRKFYFGTEKDAALKEYLRVKDDREAGREPPPPDEQRTTVKTLVNTFLQQKKSQCQLGEIGQRHFNDCLAVAERMADHFGRGKAVADLTPNDLLKYRQKYSAGRSPHTIGNEVQKVRVILRFAFENGLIDRPIRFGEFKRPAKSAFRRQRQAAGSRVFEPAELRMIIEAAEVQLRAMIYLGLNAAFGNADCGSLPLSAVDLQAGWIEYPRPKTGIDRRCPLWPKTVAALREVFDQRKPPKDSQYADKLFVTKYGQPWYTDGMRGGPISAEYRKLLKSLDLYRPGLSFYSLRHCFQTIGDETGDYLAVRRIMGHADNSISDYYRERFPDERLRKVVDHVRDWLYGSPSSSDTQTAK